MEPNKIRFDDVKVSSFIKYLASPIMSSTLPFGHAYVQDSSGEKTEILSVYEVVLMNEW